MVLNRFQTVISACKINIYDSFSLQFKPYSCLADYFNAFYKFSLKSQHTIYILLHFIQPVLLAHIRKQAAQETYHLAFLALM